MEDSVEILCPYCGELVSIEVDPSGGPLQRFVWDCEVCCRAIELEVRLGLDGEVVVRSAREDETL